MLPTHGCVLMSGILHRCSGSLCNIPIMGGYNGMKSSTRTDSLKLMLTHNEQSIGT